MSANFRILLVFSLFIGISVAEEARVWTNMDGRTITAELLSVKGEVVSVKMAGGYVYEIPLANLIEADHAFVKEWQLQASNQNEQVNATIGLSEPMVSKKGELLYETKFEDIKGWRVSSGIWVPGGSGISATQEDGEKHSAHMVTNHGRAVDVIIEYEVYIGEASTIEITIDDRPRKLGRIALNQTGFKGIPTHRTEPPSKQFNTVEAVFAPDQWHHIRVEMIGNQIVAQLGEHVTSSVDDAWAGKPKRLGLLVKKGPGKFRNLKIWEALPKL